MSDVKIVKRNTDTGKTSANVLRQRTDERGELRSSSPSPNDDLFDAAAHSTSNVSTDENRYTDLLRTENHQDNPSRSQNPTSSPSQSLPEAGYSPSSSSVTRLLQEDPSHSPTQPIFSSLRQPEGRSSALSQAGLPNSVLTPGREQSSPTLPGSASPSAQPRQSQGTAHSSDFSHQQPEGRSFSPSQSNLPNSVPTPHRRQSQGTGRSSDFSRQQPEGRGFPYSQSSLSKAVPASGKKQSSPTPSDNASSSTQLNRSQETGRSSDLSRQQPEGHNIPSSQSNLSKAVPASGKKQSPPTPSGSVSSPAQPKQSQGTDRSTDLSDRQAKDRNTSASRSDPDFSEPPKKEPAGKRTSRVDRMLNSNSDREAKDARAALKRTEIDPEVLLSSTEMTAGAAKDSVSTASKVLKKGNRLVKAGKIAAGVAVTATRFVATFSEESDGTVESDSRNVIQSAKDGAINTAKAGKKAVRGIRSIRQRRTARRTAKRAASAGRAANHAAAHQAAAAGNAGAAAASKGVAAAAEGIKQVFAAIASAAGSAIVPLLAILLAIFMVVILFVTIFGATVASPYGIFFVHEQEQELEFGEAIDRLTSSYFGRIYAKQMEDDYETVDVSCSISNSDQAWKEIISVYAVDVCKKGKDAITMDEEHYQVLKDVFWTYVSVNFRTTVTYETIEEEGDTGTTTTIVHYYDPQGNEVSAPMEGGSSWTETVTLPPETYTTVIEHKTLHINIQTTDLETMKNHYHFDEGEKATVDDLLAEDDSMWEPLTNDFTNLTVSSTGIYGTVNVTEYATVAETVYRALVDEGYTMEAACGILGNIQQESNFNPKSVNSSSGAYGLCQWLGNRLTSLQSMKDYDIATTQVAFLIKELNSQKGIWSTYGSECDHTYAGKRIDSFDDFKNADSATAAAGAFCVCFERPGEFPGNEFYEARLNYAQSWYEYAQKHWNGVSNSELAQYILNWANNKVFSEYPERPGPYLIRRFNSLTGYHKGTDEAYCTVGAEMTLYDAMREAGMTTAEIKEIVPFKDTAEHAREWAKSRGLWHSKNSGYQPKAGDLVMCSGNGKTATHTDLLRKKSGNTLYTTNLNSSRKMRKMTRKVSDDYILGYIEIPY